MAKQPFYIIILLVLAGESIFVLPFILARVFRPTFLEVFELNNTQLGYCFSIYGIIALVSYYWGGTLADRFRPNILIAVALILTALGGFFMASYPSYFMMKLLFGYWGFTTIFLFWSSMIKATRVWGGVQRQGRAFGFLEGGRGLVAASIGTISVFIFSSFIGGDIETISAEERRVAFRYVIIAASWIVVVIALLVLFFMRLNLNEDKKAQKKAEPLFANFQEVIKIPSVWLLMVIILCGYVGYKITDIFSLYANEVMLYDEIASANVGTFLLYIRPVVGVFIGLIADRSRASLWILIGFATMLIGAFMLASGIIVPELHSIFFLSLLTTALGTYSIRSLYFATLHEGKIPVALTGTAVGLISFIGYTPDIFMGPAIGFLLDGSPGETGHLHVFWMLVVFSSIGLLAAIIFYRYTLKNKA